MSANENQLLIEVFQPEVSGQVQHATSEELKRWIKEGKLKPTHQVRLKNLPWIDAQNVPAFKSLFESKKTETENQSDVSQNQTFFNSPVYKSLKAKMNEKTELPSCAGKSSFQTEGDDTEEPKNTKPAEPSIAFKLFEKKAQKKSQKTDAKTAKNEPVSKNFETAPLQDNGKSQKKSYTVKKAAGFLAGCFLMFLLSAGGSYLWVHQLKSAVQIDENSLPEVWNLSHILTAEKLDLRLRAERERSQQINVQKEIAKLENQFKNQRKNLVEQHRVKLQTTDLYNTFYFSFAALLCLFFIVKAFVGKSAGQQSGYQKAPGSLENEMPEVSDVPAAETQKVESETSENSEMTEAVETDVTKTEVVFKVKTSQKSGETKESEEELSAELFNCFLHDDKPSDFVCEDCAKFFCRECTVVNEQEENSCFFCKKVCKRVEFEENPSAPSKAEKKKPKNLLDLGKNKNFVVRWFPEKRTNRVGIIPAFLIAVLFSSAISILWVYKISPYLENRGEEVSQDVSTDETQSAEKNPESKTSEQLSNKNAETNVENSANEPCIDPQTRQPFECDEEIRRALHDHTEKVKSVEKAQKETKEKTELILSPFLSSEKSESEDANQKAPNPADEARREFEKRQLIRAFIYSFLTIFGLLMLTWLFAKDEKDEKDESEQTSSQPSE